MLLKFAVFLHQYLLVVNMQFCF